MQRDLAVGLATELRQLRADEQEMEPLWSKKVQQYVARHEKLLLIAVSSGYGEGGDNGQLWTFSGCMLFAISVLTTLGELFCWVWIVLGVDVVFAGIFLGVSRVR